MRKSLRARLVRFLKRLAPTRLTNGYRPERHYMRGPGPKSRDRGGQIAAAGEGMAASLGNGGKSPGT